MTTSRTLAAALAIGALAVPAAQAQPADNAPPVPASANTQKQDPVADIPAPLARAAANTRVQDLRHLRAGAANVPRAVRGNVGSYTPGATPGATYTSGATAGGQYTPGATSVEPTSQRRLAGPPTWPVNPQPIAPAHAVNAPDNSGVNPTTIGLGIAGSLLVLAGLVGIARRTRRVERARVTA